ncbi:MAG: CAP domain-containing protein [Bacteroidales bacterium]|jgi:uncharacterized protein YkwD
MKIIFYILFFFNLSFVTQAQVRVWTNEQLSAANTAKNANYLTQAERDVILYINLARLYPQQFLKNEVIKYQSPPKYGHIQENSKYMKALIANLKTRKPVKALFPSNECYENAKCFAKESGDAGYEGHERKKCPRKNFAECCSYGMETGRDIVMQWLIDLDVPEFGHREICLDKMFTKVGVSIQYHKKWGKCAVAEFH